MKTLLGVTLLFLGIIARGVSQDVVATATHLDQSPSAVEHEAIKEAGSIGTLRRNVRLDSLQRLQQRPFRPVGRRLKSSTRSSPRLSTRRERIQKYFREAAQRRFATGLVLPRRRDGSHEGTSSLSSQRPLKLVTQKEAGLRDAQENESSAVPRDAAKVSGQHIMETPRLLVTKFHGPIKAIQNSSISQHNLATTEKNHGSLHQSQIPSGKDEERDNSNSNPEELALVQQPGEVSQASVTRSDSEQHKMSLQNINLPVAGEGLVSSKERSRNQGIRSRFHLRDNDSGEQGERKVISLPLRRRRLRIRRPNFGIPRKGPRLVAHQNPPGEFQDLSRVHQQLSLQLGLEKYTGDQLPTPHSLPTIGEESISHQQPQHTLAQTPSTYLPGEAHRRDDFLASHVPPKDSGDAQRAAGDLETTQELNFDLPKENVQMELIQQSHTQTLHAENVEPMNHHITTGRQDQNVAERRRTGTLSISVDHSPIKHETIGLPETTSTLTDVSPLDLAKTSTTSHQEPLLSSEVLSSSSFDDSDRSALGDQLPEKQKYLPKNDNFQRLSARHQEIANHRLSQHMQDSGAGVPRVRTFIRHRFSQIPQRTSQPQRLMPVRQPQTENFPISQSFKTVASGFSQNDSGLPETHHEPQMQSKTQVRLKEAMHKETGDVIHHFAAPRHINNNRFFDRSAESDVTGTKEKPSLMSVALRIHSLRKRPRISSDSPRKQEGRMALGSNRKDLEQQGKFDNGHVLSTFGIHGRNENTQASFSTDHFPGISQHLSPDMRERLPAETLLRTGHQSHHHQYPILHQITHQQPQHQHLATLQPTIYKKQHHKHALLQPTVHQHQQHQHDSLQPTAYQNQQHQHAGQQPTRHQQQQYQHATQRSSVHQQPEQQHTTLQSTADQQQHHHHATLQSAAHHQYQQATPQSTARQHHHQHNTLQSTTDQQQQRHETLQSAAHQQHQQATPQSTARQHHHQHNTLQSTTDQQQQRHETLRSAAHQQHQQANPQSAAYQQHQQATPQSTAHQQHHQHATLQSTALQQQNYQQASFSQTPLNDRRHYKTHSILSHDEAQIGNIQEVLLDTNAPTQLDLHTSPHDHSSIKDGPAGENLVQHKEDTGMTVDDVSFLEGVAVASLLNREHINLKHAPMQHDTGKPLTGDNSVFLATNDKRLTTVSRTRTEGVQRQHSEPQQKSSETSPLHNNADGRDFRVSQAPHLRKSNVAKSQVSHLQQSSVMESEAAHLQQSSLTESQTPQIRQSSVTEGQTSHTRQSSVTDSQALHLRQASARESQTPHIRQSSLPESQTTHIRQSSVMESQEPRFRQSNVTVSQLQQTSLADSQIPHLQKSSVVENQVQNLRQSSVMGSQITNLRQSEVTKNQATLIRQSGVAENKVPLLRQSSVTGSQITNLRQSEVAESQVPLLPQSSVTKNQEPHPRQSGLTGSQALHLQRSGRKDLPSLRKSDDIQIYESDGHHSHADAYLSHLKTLESELERHVSHFRDGNASVKKVETLRQGGTRSSITEEELSNNKQSGGIVRGIHKSRLQTDNERKTFSNFRNDTTRTRGSVQSIGADNGNRIRNQVTILTDERGGNVRHFQSGRSRQVNVSKNRQQEDKRPALPLSRIWRQQSKLPLTTSSTLSEQRQNLRVWRPTHFHRSSPPKERVHVLQSSHKKTTFQDITAAPRAPATLLVSPALQATPRRETVSPGRARQQFTSLDTSQATFDVPLISREGRQRQVQPTLRRLTSSHDQPAYIFQRSHADGTSEENLFRHGDYHSVSRHPWRSRGIQQTSFLHQEPAQTGVSSRSREGTSLTGFAHAVRDVALTRSLNQRPKQQYPEHNKSFGDSVTGSYKPVSQRGSRKFLDTLRGVNDDIEQETLLRSLSVLLRGEDFSGHWSTQDTPNQGSQRQQDSQIPQTGFSCKSLTSGYYADTHEDAKCSSFHFCSADGTHTSYMCPAGTAFSQRLQVCDHAFRVECSASHPADHQHLRSAADNSNKRDQSSKRVASQDPYQLRYRA